MLASQYRLLLLIREAGPKNQYINHVWELFYGAVQVS